MIIARRDLEKAGACRGALEDLETCFGLEELAQGVEVNRRNLEKLAAHCRDPWRFRRKLSWLMHHLMAEPNAMLFVRNKYYRQMVAMIWMNTTQLIDHVLLDLTGRN